MMKKVSIKKTKKQPRGVCDSHAEQTFVKPVPSKDAE